MFTICSQKRYTLFITFHGNNGIMNIEDKGKELIKMKFKITWKNQVQVVEEQNKGFAYEMAMCIMDKAVERNATLKFNEGADYVALNGNTVQAKAQHASSGYDVNPSLDLVQNVRAWFNGEYADTFTIQINPTSKHPNHSVYINKMELLEKLIKENLVSLFWRIDKSKGKIRPKMSGKNAERYLNEYIIETPQIEKMD